MYHELHRGKKIWGLDKKERSPAVYFFPTVWSIWNSRVLSERALKTELAPDVKSDTTFCPGQLTKKTNIDSFEYHD